MTDARDRILTAAMDVVGEAGLHPWSMASVAQRAGVHRATLYRYFPGKVDLIDALPLAGAPEAKRTAVESSPTTVTNTPKAGDPGLGQGRRRLITAARELFSQQGYDATSVREIAEHAGMSKVMVYRHFGTKANLFRTATVDPFNQLITSHLRTRRGRSAAHLSVDERAVEFLTEFYAALQQHRDLLVPLLWPSPGKKQPASHAYLDRVAKQWFGVMDQVIAADPAVADFRALDRSIVGRLILGMLLSLVVYEPWLLGEPRPSDSKLIKEMADFTVFGIMKRPAAAP